MNEGLENIKQIDNLEKKLNQVLEISSSKRQAASLNSNTIK